MDRTRHGIERQNSIGTPTGSPMASLLNRHERSGSTGLANLKKQQNVAAKAAAQRLAQVMSQQSPDDDEEDEEDDLLYDYSPTVAAPSLGLAAGRAAAARPRPMSVRTSQAQLPSAHPALGARLASSVEQPPPSAHSSSFGRPSQPNISEQPLSARSTLPVRSSQSTYLVELVQPSSAHSISPVRSSQTTNTMEQPLSARSTSAGRSSQQQPLSARSTSAGCPNLVVKTVPMVPPSVPIKLRPQASTISAEIPLDSRRDKRLSLDMGSMNLRESGTQHSTSALQDEVRPPLTLVLHVLLKPAAQSGEFSFFPFEKSRSFSWTLSQLYRT
ncbi:hypothetical protein Acr_08g0003950 [Actinidia rufa]|uniref:Uncharacterized protein n=1 Tax=Actinidia rufa TaxID=165716 RepID=A0A7J0F1B1_9ERIC|nr:hypothetical protein Acr_08g0003950 [Actinidia rufa]